MKSSLRVDIRSLKYFVGKDGGHVALVRATGGRYPDFGVSPCCGSFSLAVNMQQKGNLPKKDWMPRNYIVDKLSGLS
jgi:hypothetical protein